MRAGLIVMMLASSMAGGADGHLSPYAAASNADIKSLSAEEQADLLAGRGMGLARPAELNGYPGPTHVLELASHLELSASQLAGTREIFAHMQRAAQADGAALIEAERGLDALYASKAATVASVQKQLARIEKIRAHLRAVHLNAHLEQAALLTPQQRARYAELRGYAGQDHRGH